MIEIPMVSICLPVLNTRSFIAERLSSIFDQTYSNWELIICDSYSTDGSFEYIKEQALCDNRIILFQMPPNGVYAAINECIKRSKGDYIYIATSDDTMMPDCLNLMLNEMESNSDYGLCQCNLEIIDENGVPLESKQQWENYTTGSFQQSLVSNNNKRIAPYDGVLHSALFTIYTSLTQLLIRRSVFERVGLFEGKWGSFGDFEWGMRVGLQENVIYIPEKLATWRIHPKQLTQDVHTLDARIKMIEMAASAYDRSHKLSSITKAQLTYFLRRDYIYLIFKSTKLTISDIMLIIRELPLWIHPLADHIHGILSGRAWGFWDNGERYRKLRNILLDAELAPPIY
jgi:glycosyltransferase involved in cell wall biosynthesis